MGDQADGGSQMTERREAEGLNLGTTGTSAIFLTAILALVVYLSVTKTDQTPPEVVQAEIAGSRPAPA